VYEVFQVSQGIALNYTDHMERLQRSLKGLQIKSPLTAAGIQSIVAQLLKKNNQSDATIYLQITRGISERAHIFPHPAVAPTVIMSLIRPPKSTPQEYEQGAKAIIVPEIRWKRRDLKTISLLPNILAKQEAHTKGAVEAIFVEDDGVITEGSSMNVFMVDSHNVIWTHPENNHILSGVTRRNIIVLAETIGLRVKEHVFTENALLEAKEVFLTSTTKHVLPVTTINDTIINEGNVGPLTKQLMTTYGAFLEGQLEEQKLSHPEN
jgi:D-alanine transaminase